MKAIRRQSSRITVLLATGAFLAGCVAERHARVGMVYERDLEPGHPVPDFSFVGEDGKVETFSHVRSVVTIVALPDDPDWPNCHLCKQIEQLASRLTVTTTPISVVSIGSPSKPCEDAASTLHECRIKGYAQLTAVCDYEGCIRRLYGPNSAGKFFVVDFSGRISAEGRITDLAAMEQAVRVAVDEHERYWESLYPSDD